jgi:hypothetical protein
MLKAGLGEGSLKRRRPTRKKGGMDNVNETEFAGSG